MRAAPKKKAPKRAPLFTIGYEQAKPAAVFDELKRARVELLVDTRAVAASRRPGFSKGQLAGWEKVLARHAILAQQQFAYTTGKNSTDITLVIDAMDLLHSGRFDGFCLVSSDSDFTRLAARIREQGVDVYGIGQAKTPESFRQACTRFIFTENFVREPNGATEPKAALRPLSEAERNALPLLARGAALRFLLTRLVDWFDVPPGALVRPKDPFEYYRKLRFHQAVKSASDYGIAA